MQNVSPRKHVIPFRSVIKWMVRLRRSPRAIAGGFALGTFIAFTPTMGVQFAIVLFLATLLNMNRPAALVTIWITNVATMAPIYTFNYWVGSLMWEGPSTADVYHVFADLAVQMMKLDGWEMLEQFKAVMNLSQEIIIPLIIGSILVGLIAAFIVYVASFAMLRYLLMRKHRKRILS
ncbi:DUF2062 domain-containing protein [Desulfofustis limnaeus]|nr:DUF2062 domain-containing protein [Desulfofustis limnaeus]MDX9894149.1 DUF2062 domain-containing protein [Desulfofustis sp.]